MPVFASNIVKMLLGMRKKLFLLLCFAAIYYYFSTAPFLAKASPRRNIYFISHTIALMGGMETAMEIYTTRAGDTPSSVARRFGLSEAALIHANQLGDPRRLTAGLALLIPGRETAPQKAIEIGACVAPCIPDSVLQELLPCLSFLCPFAYRISPDGAIIPIETQRILHRAQAEHCPSLLALSNLGANGEYSSATAHALLSLPQSREQFFSCLFQELESGGYRGVYLNFAYLYPFDREIYNSFLLQLSQALHSRGLYLISALAPKEQENSEALLCAAHDYAVHGALADRVVLLSYDWGYSGSAPQAVSPVNRIVRVLDYACKLIPAGKLLLGLSNYGYNWNLPWRLGDCASPIAHASAVNLAISVGAEIKYDTAFQASYFSYCDSGGQRHIVWFEDPRSLLAKLKLLDSYGLAGICHWTVNRSYRPALSLIQSRYFPEVLL